LARTTNSTRPEKTLTAAHDAAQRRKHLVERIAGELDNRAYPRLTMLAVVAAAGGAGFFSSVALLRMGLGAPMLRYPLAAAIGYLAFLGMVRLWLAWRQRQFSAHVDLPGLDTGLPDAEHALEFGGGDGLAGDGSGASFGTADAAAPAVEAKSSLLGGGLGAVADADEGAIILVPIAVGVAIAVGLIASGAVLYNAPVLLAEVLLDSAIATVAYRRLRNRSTVHWSTGVLRRTWKPMAAIALALVALGAVISAVRPGADSIGDLLR
jgi:hypothetical protein